MGIKVSGRREESLSKPVTEIGPLEGVHSNRGSYLVNLFGIFETLCHLPDSINSKGFKSIACSIFYTLTEALFINNAQQCF